jgi:Heterokaryon incompatibility protein (HET)
MNMDNRPAYPKLTASNSTRVLELAADLGNDQDVLRGRLIEINLDNAPKFEAVSYVWGQRKATSKILCKTPDGAEEEITITGNCKDLLRRFRHRDTCRLLWIDAICINQRDLMERNQQVSIMSRVYAKAHCVLVWLPNDDAEKWADFDPVALRGRPTGQSSRDYYFALRQGFQRLGLSSWFKRVWTVLEFAFARDCHMYYSKAEPISAIELSKMDGRLLLFSAQPQSYLTQVPGNPLSTSALRCKVRGGVIFSETGQRDSSEQRTTLDIIIESRSLEASLEVDHVFALYSIFETNPSIVNRLQKPDYTKSKEQVFWDSTVAIIKEHGIRFLSNLPGIKPSAMHGSYPSWVPDLSIPGRRPMKNGFAIRRCQTLFTEDKRQVHLKGLVLHDSVVSLTASTNSSGTRTESQRIVLDSQEQNLQGDSLEFEIKAWHVFLLWYDMVTLFVDSTTTLSKLFKDFFACMAYTDGPGWGLNIFLPAIKPFILLLVEPVSRGTLKEPDTFSCFQPLKPGNRLGYANDLADFIKSNTRVRTQPAEERLDPGPLASIMYHPENRHPATGYLESTLIDREFFITKDGFMGLTNGYVEEGDVLALLPGLWMPLLLRKDSSSNRYSCVGVASIKSLEPTVDQCLFGQLEANPTTLGHALWNQAIASKEYIYLV